MNITNYVLSATVSTLLTTSILAPGNYIFEYNYFVNYQTGLGPQETMQFGPSTTGGAIIQWATAEMNEESPGASTDQPRTTLSAITSQCSAGGAPVLWQGAIKGNFTVSTAGTMSITGQLGGGGGEDAITINGRLRLFLITPIGE